MAPLQNGHLLVMWFESNTVKPVQTKPHWDQL